MYQRILLAYDGSTESQQALLNCKDLSQWKHAKVHLLSVMPHDLVAMGHESALVYEEDSKFDEKRRLIILADCHSPGSVDIFLCRLDCSELSTYLTFDMALCA